MRGGEARARRPWGVSDGRGAGIAARRPGGPLEAHRSREDDARAGEWDGVTVAGSTAASILGIGDFYLSPYRILAPRRINSRNAEARFGIRGVPRDDVSFIEGIPVTGAERTLVDLVLDGEEPSLVQDAFADARAKGLDTEKLERLAAEAKASARERKTMERLFGGEA